MLFRFVSTLVCLLFLPLGAGAQAGQEPDAARSPNPAATTESGGEEGVFVDAETGQAYRVAPVARVEGKYRFLDERQTRVRLQFGLEAEVERVDEENIWIRIYESRKRNPRVAAKPAPPKDVLPATSVGRLRWVPADAGLPQRGLWREGFDFGDFDGDGRDELVLPPPRKARAGSASRPRIFRREGDGWEPWSPASFPAQSYDYGDVAVLDYDDDGIQDVALAMHLTGVQLFRGLGDGSFERIEGFPGGPIFHSRAIRTIEIGTHRLLLALGEGMAGASPQSSANLDRDVVNRGFAGWRFAGEQIERLAGDGAEVNFGFGDDFAVGHPGGPGESWVALATRRLRAREVLVRLVQESSSVRFEAAALPLRHSSAYHGGVTFADTDGDGRDELFFGSQTTSDGDQRTHLDRYRLGSGAEATWTSEPVVSMPSQDGIWSLARGDLNGDGLEDVVAGTGGGEIWVFLAEEGGMLRRDLSIGLPAPKKACTVRELMIRPVTDRDAKPELPAGDSAGRASVEVFALFSGEPVSDPTGATTRGTGCDGGGRVAVWRVSLVRAPVDPLP